jgi:single-strand DNA-binding protein
MVNDVTLIGNVGQTPEMRFTNAGTAVTNVRLATHERWHNKTTGKKGEKTEWHRVVLYGGMAEAVNKGCVKGSLLYIEGKITTRKWTDKVTGETKYTPEIEAKDFRFLESKGARTDNGPVPKEATPPVQEQPPMGDDVPF